jgi:16S rRNA (cytosine1402-N4)-methyltransferase
MSHDQSSTYHEPVLVDEVLEFLAPEPGETVLDATVGGGGHSILIAARLTPGGILIALDRDVDALAASGKRLAPLRTQITIITVHAEFGKIDSVLDGTAGTDSIRLDGALFDLGISSHQVDTGRGFSFRRDEPLDMRMDATTGESAADVLAQSTEAELARLIWENGEERFARRIARTISAERSAGRPIKTTGSLAGAVERSVPRAAWPRDIHVATRTFQALRIVVNDEMGQLRKGLAAAIDRLRPGGRVVVISYHSLEDRIVKQAFARCAGKTSSPPRLSPGVFLDQAPEEPTLTLLTRKPVVPGEAEAARNPRSRSAKLRAAARPL